MLVHHKAELKSVAQGVASRNSIGGYPFSDAEAPPTCQFTYDKKTCGKRMAMFLQVDVSPDWKTPFKPGSHFAFYACPEHDDPFPADAGKHLGAPALSGARLPDKYWHYNDGNYAMYLLPPGEATTKQQRDPYLVNTGLEFISEPEPEQDSVEALNYPNLKFGGSPFWLQDPEIWRCCCGEAMSFLLQVPEFFEFPKLPEAEEQPNSYSADQYLLFLGNSVFVFACSAQCNPKAVWAAWQN